MFDSIDSSAMFRLAGLSGFALYVSAYAMVGWRMITAESLHFFAANTVAAALVLLSNFGEFNLASVLIQIFFIFIGVSAILLRFRHGARERQPD